MQESKQSFSLDGFLCAALTILTILCTRPFAKLGFVDDWSYIQSSQVFAQTGHFVYNGWATAMLGWQIPWGALFIKLFGFSFTAPRISTLVSAFFCVCIFHNILRRFGINRRNSILGCLVLGFSPLFFPLAPTFLTDINGLLVILLCLAMCLRSLESRTDRAAFCWLIAAAVFGTIGGTVRQIAWVGVLATVPACAWLMRRRRGALLLGIALWLLGVASIILIIHWWQSQPGALSEPLVEAKDLQLRALPQLAYYALRVFLEFCVYLLPLLTAWLVRTKRFSRREKIFLPVFAVTLLIAALVPHRVMSGALVVPWIGDSTSSFLLLGPPLSLGPAFLRKILAVVVIISFACFLIGIRRNVPLLGSGPVTDQSWRAVLGLVLPTALLYGLLLLPRLLRFAVFDRYFLGLLVFTTILLLKFHQDFEKPNLPAVSYAMLALLGFYSVTSTHDSFSMNRAIAAAADRLMSSGIPRAQINGGSSFDGWTQLTATGMLNDPRTLHAPYDSHVPKLNLPEKCSFSFLDETPVVQPAYFLSTQPLSCLRPSRLGEVPYSTWLTFNEQAIYILELPKGRME